MPINCISCIACKKPVSLKGPLSKVDVSTIAFEINKIRNEIIEKRKEEEFEQRLQDVKDEHNRQLSQLSAKRRKLKHNNKKEDDEEEEEFDPDAEEKMKDMLVDAEVEKLFPRFEKMLYLLTPCCHQVFDADGCQAIECSKCKTSFCGLCLEEEFCFSGDGEEKYRKSHDHVKNCLHNMHFKGDYFTHSFYPQYCCYRRFGEAWNDFLYTENISMDLIARLLEKIKPLIIDSNLILDDTAQMTLKFTPEQEIIMNPPPIPERRVRRYRCGHCRDPGHNRARCPIRLRENEEARVREQEAIDNNQVVVIE